LNEEHLKNQTAMAEAGFSLSTLGFSELEDLTLQAVLTLSERALSARWRHQKDIKRANAVLVFVDSPEGAQFWDSDTRNHSSACFVACSSQGVADARWTLDLRLHELPSRKKLVNLLNTLSEHLAKQAAETLKESADGKPRANPSQPPTGAKPIDRPAFEPGGYLLGLLQKAMAAGQDSIFALPNRGAWLAVSPKAQRYYAAAPVDQLQALLQSRADDIHSRALPVEKLLESAIGKDLSHRPLAELLWQAALASSGGRLLTGRSPKDVVRLKHWPPITYLPSFRAFLRIAAFMGQNAASLESVAEHTGAPLETVFDFHNACEALDLLERDPAPSPAVKTTTDLRKKDLYKKISSRLARGQTNPTGNSDGG
jgi:hypothetical protein